MALSGALNVSNGYIKSLTYISDYNIIANLYTRQRGVSRYYYFLRGILYFNINYVSCTKLYIMNPFSAGTDFMDVR